MLLVISAILLTILLARIFEELFKVPYILSILVLAYSFNSVFPELFDPLASHFDDIILLMLPLILLPDLFNLSIKEIRKHLWDFSYLTLFSSIAAVTLGVLIVNWLLPEYQLSLMMLIALFIILITADSASVSSLLERFELPETLKIYARGESFFNNILALVLFYFIALPLISGDEIGILSFNQHTFEVLLFSVVTGFVVAFIGYLGLKVIQDPIEQLIILYLVCIISFVVAEYWQIIGIVSLFTAIIVFKIFSEHESQRLHKEIKNADLADVAQCSKSYASMVSHLIQHLPAVSRRGMRDYRKEAYYIGVFANTLVFVCVANLMQLSQLWEYAREIFIVFLLVSLIRYFFIRAFVYSHNFQPCWGNFMTLVGMKGGLSIIMVYSLPESFSHKPLFEAIVVGVVLLSTFMYSLLNTLYLHIYHCEFMTDPEETQERADKLVKTLQDIVVKEPISQGYSCLMFEELLDKEIGRAKRYDIELSLILVQLYISPSAQSETLKLIAFLGEVVNSEMRDNDLFGKISENTYGIVGVNTNIEGINVLAQRVANKFNQADWIKPLDIQLKIAMEELKGETKACQLIAYTQQKL